MLTNDFSIFNRPESKEGKEAETEKKAEQENNESDKIEKELEKDKVSKDICVAKRAPAPVK